jgi:hypothetical protein
VVGWLVDEPDASVSKVDPDLTTRFRVAPERVAVTGSVVLPLMAFTNAVATVAAVEFCA